MGSLFSSEIEQPEQLCPWSHSAGAPPRAICASDSAIAGIAFAPRPMTAVSRMLRLRNERLVIASMARRVTGVQCTAQARHGSKERITRATSIGCFGSATGVPMSAVSMAPGRPRSSRGEQFQVVGTTHW